MQDTLIHSPDRQPTADFRSIDYKSAGVFTEQRGLFIGAQRFGSFDRLNAASVHVAMRIVARIHEAFAAQLIDNRAQVLIAFKAAQDSALQNIFTRFMDSGRQLTGLSFPSALFTGTRLENMLDVFSHPPIPIRQQLAPISRNAQRRFGSVFNNPDPTSDIIATIIEGLRRNMGREKTAAVGRREGLLRIENQTASSSLLSSVGCMSLRLNFLS